MYSYIQQSRITLADKTLVYAQAQVQEIQNHFKPHYSVLGFVAVDDCAGITWV